MSLRHWALCSTLLLSLVGLGNATFAQSDTTANAHHDDASGSPAILNMEEVTKAIGYPSEAKEARIEGNVVVRILVDAEGKYLKHELLKDPHPILSAAVLAHLPELRFAPIMKDNAPISVWVTIPFRFHQTQSLPNKNWAHGRNIAH